MTEAPKVMPPKILPQHVKTAAFNSHKAIRVSLPDNISIDDARSKPALWKAVQGEIKLARGDYVTLIGGGVMADMCVVTKAVGGEIWLSKPLRLVTLEEEALFEDASWQVVPVGVGYSLKNKRSGRVDEVVFTSVEAARNEVFQRQPRKA